MSAYQNETTAARCAFVLFNEVAPDQRGYALSTIAQNLWANGGLHPEDICEFIEAVCRHLEPMVMGEPFDDEVVQ